MQLCDACAEMMEAAILQGETNVLLCGKCLARLTPPDSPIEIGVERRTVDELFEVPAEALEVVSARPVTDGYWLTLNDGRMLFLSLSMLDPTAFAH